MAKKELVEKQIFNAQDYLACMAPLSGVDIKQSWEPIVCAHLNTAAKMADIVDSAAIDPNTIDLANTFSPN